MSEMYERQTMTLDWTGEFGLQQNDKQSSSSNDCSPSTSSQVSQADSEESCSSQLSSQSSVTHRNNIARITKRKMTKQIHQSKFKSLVAAKERKRIGKFVGRRYQDNTTLALKKWKRCKEKIDREFDPQLREMIERTERLQREHRELLQANIEAKIKNDRLAQECAELRAQAESRQLATYQALLRAVRMRIEQTDDNDNDHDDFVYEPDADAFE
ncbi:hypothetical protein WR25_17852 [Diploscapter pachys]|uniref:Uncharacterized protein n=1 Tax=Diploscapter pachys TaxID=2018661 RepID=A0A2A2JMH8_9BILA|nr:hypothetical protein WR25_17852 [Diploscapter pachys]